MATHTSHANYKAMSHAPMLEQLSKQYALTFDVALLDNIMRVAQQVITALPPTPFLGDGLKSKSLSVSFPFAFTGEDSTDILSKQFAWKSRRCRCSRCQFEIVVLPVTVWS